MRTKNENLIYNIDDISAIVSFINIITNNKGEIICFGIDFFTYVKGIQLNR